MNVLVAYASARGSTHEIAQHIAARMAVALGEVQCMPVDEVESISDYDACVIGSAIHNQAWLPPASLFLARHGPELAKRPVWAFSVGMADALPRPFRKHGASLEQARLSRTLSNEVQLMDHKIFSGVYQANQMPMPLRILFRITGGRFGDLRNWAAVNIWTDQVIGRLSKPAE